MVLTILPHDPVFDLPPWVGQRQATFRFSVVNSVTGEELGEVHPLRQANLSHDTTRTIKRQLTLDLGREETTAINPVQDRISPRMVLPSGVEYPLGRYMFTTDTRAIFTSGDLGTFTLSDEMFKLDQQIETSVGRRDGQTVAYSCEALLNQALAGRGVTFTIEAGQFVSDQGWSIGTNLGSILEDLASTGDWFSPWFDFSNVLRFIRTFQPGDQIPDFDWDAGNQVLRAGISKTGNLLTVPNRFIVIGNTTSDAVDSGNVAVQPGTAPVVGIYDVPSTYPYSIANRGFVIPDVTDMAVVDAGQAQAAARALAIRNGAFEQLQVSTAPDPRHESYNVIWWREMAWLETAWTMQLVEGGTMAHTLRRAYT